MAYDRPFIYYSMVLISVLYKVGIISMINKVLI